MMATTHALTGACIGVAAAAIAPVEVAAAVAAGAVGGFGPDLDLLWEHRKTLHFPGFGSLAAVAAVCLAVAAPSVVTITFAVGAVAAAAHAVSDLFGGGLSLRPWNPSSDRGVYEHVRGRWHPPRRWIRYDGAPEDAFLAGAFGLVAYAGTSGAVRSFVVALVVVSVVYAAVRRRLVDGGRRLVAALPPGLVRVIPDSLIEDLR